MLLRRLGSLPATIFEEHEGGDEGADGGESTGTCSAASRN